MVDCFERRAAYVLALAIGFSCMRALPAAAQTRPCWDTAVTQAQLNACAAEEAKAAEAEMNRVFAEVLRVRGADRAFVRKLRAAQAAWIKYRDAELAARFPTHDSARQYGSSFQMCSRSEHARLFKERTAALRALLPADKTKDVCAVAR